MAAPVENSDSSSADHRASRSRHVKTSRRCELRLLRRPLELDISEEKKGKGGVGFSCVEGLEEGGGGGGGNKEERRKTVKTNFLVRNSASVSFRLGLRF